MCIRWSPVWWLRIRADRLQKRAASEQAVADQELLLEEMRKQFANRHLDVRLEHEDLAEAMRHNRTLATLARQKEYAAASDLSTGSSSEVGRARGLNLTARQAGPLRAAPWRRYWQRWSRWPFSSSCILSGNRSRRCRFPGVRSLSAVYSV